MATSPETSQLYKLPAPDGKTYQLSGPVGATQSELEAELVRQQPHLLAFETTPGGAAVGNPTATRKADNARASSDGVQRMTDIGGATAMGGVAGYFGPQILQGAATLAQSVPMLRPISGALNFASQATKQIGPVARTVSGAVSGGVGETSGQVAEQLGAGPVTAEVARFGGGAVAPAVAPLALGMVKLVTSGKLPTAAINYTKDFLAKLNKSPDSLTTAEKEVVNRLTTALRGEQDPDKAMLLIGEEMERGAAAIRLAAQNKSESLHAAADQAILTAKQAAEAELGSVGQRQQPRADAITYLTNLKKDVINKAKGTIAVVGEDRPLHIIGNELQTAAAQVQKDLKKVASDTYNATADKVNTIVANREGSGESVTSLPAYTSLIKSLESELKPGVHSRDAAAAYQKILDQIKILGEKDKAGNAPNLTSFQAIDDARRMLGEAFRGQGETGYAALKPEVQKRYYGLLSKVQKDFAGEEQSKLLAQYADSRPGLEVFGSKAGTKLTSMDSGAMSRFATDESKIPSYFFSTPKNYNALIEMVGSKELALKAAQQYAANQLAPKETSKQVGTWMTTNREFLSAVPEVRDAVIKYRATLENGERAVASMGSGVKQLNTANTGIFQRAVDTAKDILQTGKLQATAARTEAKGITQEAANAADNVWNSLAGPQKNARDLILSGNMEKWATVAPIIERSPDAKKAVFDAVRQVTSEMGSSKGVTQKFNENMRPALEKFGMLGRDEAESIAQQLAAIEAKRVPDSEKLGLARKLLLDGIVGYSGSLGGRAGVGAGAAGFSFASDIPRGNSVTQNQLAPAPARSQNAMIGK